jgi:acyl carrier protein
MDAVILIFEKLKKILADNLDCEDTEITLNTHLSNLGADDLGIMEIFMNIEEEFEVEVSDIEEDCIYVVKDIVKRLLYKSPEIILDKSPEIIFDELERERKKRKNLIETFRFFNNNNINEKTMIKILENDTFISNIELIKNFVSVVKTRGFTLGEISEFAIIFQNNFLISNIENIGKIIGFVEATEISIDEIISFIQDGGIQSINQKCQSLRNSILEKENEIQNRVKHISQLNQEINNLNQKIQNLQHEIQDLQNEINIFYPFRK